MKPALDCIPCLLRQTLDAARVASPDPAVHERLLRVVLSSLDEADLRRSPPVVGQGIHRRLRELTGLADPYAEAEGRQNRLAIALLPALEAQVAAAADPFDLAVRLAIAGNVIDLGPNGDLTESDVRRSVEQALREPVDGPLAAFRSAAERAERILYLADNARGAGLRPTARRAAGPTTGHGGRPGRAGAQRCDDGGYEVRRHARSRGGDRQRLGRAGHRLGRHEPRLPRAVRRGRPGDRQGPRQLRNAVRRARTRLVPVQGQVWGRGPAGRPSRRRPGHRPIRPGRWGRDAAPGRDGSTSSAMSGATAIRR